MHWSRLVLAGRLLVALVAVFAFSGLAATAAQAVEAPSWTREGVSLGAGETHFIAAKAYSTKLSLIAAGYTISCESLKLKEGSLLGSNAGNAGKNNEVIEFTKCAVTGTGITKCIINGPIVTNPVKSELVETEKAEPEKEEGSLLTLFEPAPGSNGFTTLKFTAETGGKCPPETKVTGKVAGQTLTDPENGELGKLIELGQAQEEAKSWLLNFPSKPITRVTRISGGKASELNVELTAFTESATLEGTTLLSLAKKNSKGEFEVEEANWGFSIAFPGTLSANPNPVNFVTVNIATEKFKILPVTIENVGLRKTIKLPEAKVTNGKELVYSIAKDECRTKELEPRKKCIIEVKFEPTAKKAYDEDELIIKGYIRVPLVGEGV